MLAGSTLEPGVQALRVRGGGMQRRGGAEALFETTGRLRRECDLGHQHEGLLTAREHRFDGAQINLGLATPGDAFEQQRPVRAERILDRRHRKRLLVGERDR